MSAKKEMATPASISDLAPFVAAVLRDGVVTDLLQELNEYRNHFNKVEITGPKGKPVYAYADLAEGKDGGNPNLWHVNFKAVRRVTVNELQHIQVQLGGVVLASFDDRQNFQIFLDEPDVVYPMTIVNDATTTTNNNNDNNNSNNNENSNIHETLRSKGRILSCCFSGSSTIWLRFVLGPMTREEYDRIGIIDPDDVLNALVNEFQNQSPKRLVFFDFAIDKPSIYDRLGMLEKMKGMDTNRDFDWSVWESQREEEDDDDDDDDDDEVMENVSESDDDDDDNDDDGSDD